MKVVIFRIMVFVFGLFYDAKSVYGDGMVIMGGRGKREVTPLPPEGPVPPRPPGVKPWQPDNPSLRAFIPRSYDRYKRPQSPNGGPLPIFISTKVRDIQKIDEQDMEVTIEWYIRLYWRDSNLTAPAHLADGEWQNIAPQIAEYVWLPTTYIDHAREITQPTLLVEPVSFRMKNDGMIRYSMSVTTRVSCPMDFSAYPFDSQICYLNMESYQFNTAQVAYKWHEKRDVERSKNIRLGQFDFDFYPIKQQNISHSTGSFPTVKIEIVLRRRISYHLLNTFLPSGLFVCVSWLTFLVPPDQVPGRMVLTITTLLTLVSMFAAVRQESPKVSYAKAVDQWMIMCVIFVFFVLLEFTIVIKLYELGRRAAIRQPNNSPGRVFPSNQNNTPRNSFTGSQNTRPGTTSTIPASELKDADSSPGEGRNRKKSAWEGGRSDISLISPPGLKTPRFVKSSEQSKEEVSQGCVGETMGCIRDVGWTEWGDRVERWSLKFFPMLFFIGNLGYWVFWLSRRRESIEGQ